MAAKLDIKEGLQRALHVTVPAQEWQGKTAELLNKRAKTAKIQGFRPGKAPLDVVRSYYGAAVAEQALDELVSKHLFEACKEQQVVPVSRPTIESIKAEPEQDIEFSATFEVEPTIEALNIAGIELEKVVSEVTDADIEKVISNLQKQLGRFEVVDAPAAAGHRVTLDFTGYVDGTEFEGGKAERFQLVLGEGRMIPGFEDGVMGMKAGEDKRIAVTFPAEYHAAALAGKAAEFDIKVQQVEQQVLAELDEAFCRSLGVSDGQVTTLQTEIRTTLEREMHKNLRNKLREQAFDKLVAANPIEVPKTEVHDEIHQLMAQAKERFQQMAGGKAKNIPELPHSMFEAEALKRVTIGYLVRALIRLEQLDVSEAEVRELAEELAGPYENPAEVIRYHLNDKQRHNQLKALAMEYKVVQHVVDKAVVTEKKVSHAELTGEAA